MKQVLESEYTIQACNVQGYLIYQPIRHKMGITLTVQQYRCSIGTFRAHNYKNKRNIFLKLDIKNYSINAQYPYSYNPYNIYKL